MILYFSLHTGEIYEVLEDEESTLDQFQIPLKSKPNGCSKCKDRFHTGFNLNTNMFVVCNKCKSKLVDWDKIKVDNVVK